MESFQIGKFTGWKVGRIVASCQVDKVVCCHSDRLQGLQVTIILGWQVGRVGILKTCKMLGFQGAMILSLQVGLADWQLEKF